jgi:hypothetical protein
MMSEEMRHHMLCAFVKLQLAFAIQQNKCLANADEHRGRMAALNGIHNEMRELGEILLKETK